MISSRVAVATVPTIGSYGMSGEAYLTRGAFEFLKELRAHNNRDWFQANKEPYEEQVREPFLRLIADLAPGLKKTNSSFVTDPSSNGGSMMRIYRDIRFSKDKSRTRHSSLLLSGTLGGTMARPPHTTSASNQAHL